MNNKIYYIFPILFLFLMSCGKKDNQEFKYKFQNPDLPTEERVEDLLKRLTLEQKADLMCYNSHGVDSLGIAPYNWWNECLHGVARAGLATVFPQAVGMAATWDTAQFYKTANVISDEARAKHHEFIKRNKHGIYQGLTFWSPNINIFRDPRWGRGMETYGEDPYLTGKLAVQFIKGLQGEDPKYLKLVATSKHFVVHSGPESERHFFDAQIDDRDFKETYTPQFEMTVKEGKVYSMMCAYNRYKGEACCGSKYLLTDLFRNKWGFNGYVTSDCWAIEDFYGEKKHNIVKDLVEASALAVKSGTDLSCSDAYRELPEAVKRGLITEAEIDVSVRRLLTARFKLGMFDPQDRVPYSKIPYSVVDCQQHKDAALEMTRKSIVLLKNENNLLPLSKDLKTIAVIGPNADDEETLLGNYNGFPSKFTTALHGIKEKLPNAKVLYSRGCAFAQDLPFLDVVRGKYLFTDATKTTAGLKAEYFNGVEWKDSLKAYEQIDTVVDFNWLDKMPKDIKDDDNFSIRWTGVIVPPVSGKYALGAQGMNGVKLYINDSLLLRSSTDHEALKSYEFVELKAGVPVKVKLEYFNKSSDAFAKLLWDLPNQNYEKEALAIASQAEVVVMCMGLSPRLEGEEMKVRVEGFSGGDRIILDLPKIQQDLIQKIHKLGKPVVLVLMNGSAVAINWESKNIPAIVEAWYGGQSAGTAIADVLFGDYNPAGRLPVTFYASVSDIPAFNDYRMQGRTYRYFKGQALYQFGHGLSYTTFKYSGLKIPANVPVNQNITVSVEVENTGKRDGDEVVQLYVSQNQPNVTSAIRSLQGFARIHLKAGEKKTVSFTLKPNQYSVINNDFKRTLLPGKLTISVGGQQPQTTASDSFVTGNVEITGAPMIIE